MITDELKMNHRKIEVERAHRTGKPTTGPGDMPRTLVAKLLRFKDKVAVLERAHLNMQYQTKVWTHLLIQGFYFIFTIFYIVE